MIPVQQSSFTIPAGGSFPLQCNGRYFRIQSATGTLKVVGDTFGNIGALGVGQGLHLRDHDPVFQRLTFIDTSGAPNIVSVVIADSDFVDNSLLGTVSVIDGEKARTLSGVAFSGAPAVTAGAGVLPICQLWNPAGSGKNLVAQQMTFSSNTAGYVYAYAAAGSLGTDVTANQAQSKKLGAAMGVGKINQGTAGALTAVDFWSAAIGANGSLVWLPKGGLVIPPGQGLTIEHGTAASSLLTNFEWFEESL